MANGKTDITSIAAVAAGVGALGLGLYFFTKKPPGTSPGDVIRAHFEFDYTGDGGDYILLVRFGYHRLESWFDPEEGLDRYLLGVNLPGPDSYNFDVDCLIPDGAPKRTYDAEGSILLPTMEPGQDWILRVFNDKAITVR